MKGNAKQRERNIGRKRGRDTAADLVRERFADRIVQHGLADCRNKAMSGQDWQMKYLKERGEREGERQRANDEE
jgi:hypothetical protein